MVWEIFWLKFWGYCAIFQHGVDIFPTGLFELTAELEYITICPRHRESYGIRWTCGKTRCSIHREFSGHTAQPPPKGNRGVNLFQAKTLFSETGKVIPVGSRKFLCFEVDWSLFIVGALTGIRALNKAANTGANLSRCTSEIRGTCCWNDDAWWNKCAYTPLEYGRLLELLR